VTVLGLRANAAQFALLVALNALVGAMVGLERSVLPLVGERDFGLSSKTAVLTFVLAFGVAKALANLLAGSLAERTGRLRLLTAGWLLALPVGPLLWLAPDWSFVIAANVFLGASQGFAWSMTVVMKVDLAGPARRGLALGLNESSGYLGVAGAAFVTGALAGSFAPRSVVAAGGTGVAVVGALATILFVRDTRAHVAVEAGPAGPARAGVPSHGVLRACSQAGFVNNLNDALAWGLLPLVLAARGLDAAEIGAVAAVYPAVWGALQVASGWLSDRIGRKGPIAAGMVVQAGALTLLAFADAFVTALAAAAVLGVGTALAYPTLLAAVSDAVSPHDRAQALGVYRFWRDSGFVVGALLIGALADTAGVTAAVAAVALLTAASGAWVARARGPWTRPHPSPRAMGAIASER
jgi:MFS family permease